jgi:hypothetical protein
VGVISIQQTFIDSPAGGESDEQSTRPPKLIQKPLGRGRIISDGTNERARTKTDHLASLQFDTRARRATSLLHDHEARTQYKGRSIAGRQRSSGL